MKVGVVVTEILDGRFVPWESSLEWESYLDLYCLALMKRGHTCIKYVPSIGISKTLTYRHRFGHVVKRVPAHNGWLLAPRALLRTREYALGHTTIFRPALGPAFTANLLKEATTDGVQILHYSSYYSSFFVPAFLAAWRLPIVTQYTGGKLPESSLSRLFWKVSILPSLKASRAVLLGEYESEVRSLVTDLNVPTAKQEFFNAPIVDSAIFHPLDKRKAQEVLGFDVGKTNILCVTYLPTRQSHSSLLSKDPYLMLDVFERAVKSGGEEIEIHVAGWGQGATEFKEYVRERDMAGRVRIFGPVEHSQLPLYYSAADLLFVPYGLERLNEGSATIEAFACSRPVAAFRRDASNRTEQSGGFLVDVDPERGAAILLDRLRRPGYLASKGEEGMTLAAQYTLDFAGNRLEEIYSKVLRETNRR